MDKPEQSYIVYEYRNEACGLECGKAAIYIVNSFLKHKKINVQQTIERIKEISKDTDLGPSTSAIFNEAKSRGIPVSRLGNESIIQLGYGKYQRRQQATLADTTSCIAVDISSDKHLTKALLKQQGIPVPDGKMAYSEISALEAAKEIGFPVAVKPYNGNQGKGVHLNLKNEREMKPALKDAFLSAMRNCGTLCLRKGLSSTGCRR
jgi:cyanophycin synthetase